jgi:phosphoenolpyruvate synthase/pyruvate phosphate dikinase
MLTHLLHCLIAVPQTFGISRDDAQAKFLQFYTKNGLLALDPFETVDAVGVGELIKIAVERGRATRPDIELGICGEHGGDPVSINLFEQVRPLLCCCCCTALCPGSAGTCL